MKDDDNPMNSADAAPRCRAKTKSTGERCKAPAVNGWRVCRVHGAGGGHLRARRIRRGNTGCGRENGPRSENGSTT